MLLLLCCQECVIFSSSSKALFDRIGVKRCDRNNKFVCRSSVYLVYWNVVFL